MDDKRELADTPWTRPKKGGGARIRTTVTQRSELFFAEKFSVSDIERGPKTRRFLGNSLFLPSWLSTFKRNKHPAR